MCGIAGLVRLKGAAFRVDESVLVKMRDTMAHRGPDGAGAWLSADGGIGLAHRRLAVVDPSRAADQPMANDNGSLQLVFNGETISDLSALARLAKGAARSGRTPASRK